MFYNNDEPFTNPLETKYLSKKAGKNSKLKDYQAATGEGGD
jgi:hypothetical protein